MKLVIVTPTYNERRNIDELLPAIRKACTRVSPDILVVDSASPDGTAQAVQQLQKSDPQIFLIEQKAKMGLGNAYLEGMRWVLAHDYDVMIMMDADFSHHPRYLNTMIEEIEKNDLVVGSRYVPNGGVENWPFYRLFLSRFANWYAKTLMGLPFTDLTSGYHCFRTPLLRKVLRYNIHTEGYAFLVELKSLTILQGANFKEIPIIFGNRVQGDSKISKRVILESMLFVMKRTLQRYRFKIRSQQKSRSKSSFEIRAFV